MLMKKIFLLFMGLVLFSNYAFGEKKISLTTVSYTHLTLPTTSRV